MPRVTPATLPKHPTMHFLPTPLKIVVRALLLGGFLTLLAFPARATRIKDVTMVEGGRDNQLVGYGLVVGLAGDGDSKINFTVQSVANMLKRFGVNVPASEIKSGSVAAVMITADLGPFRHTGSRLDVTVSTLGDAKSLQGGVLLQTPLLGADEKVYAAAQGPLALGGFVGGAGGAGGATVQKNHPTVGTISGGAIVEREVPTQFAPNGAVNLLLRSPDFATASRVAEVINQKFTGAALAKDASTVSVYVPIKYMADYREVDFMTVIGGLDVVPDAVARVVINERTGTIIATSDVRISKVAISHGSLTITIASNTSTSQPAAMSNGQTTQDKSTQTDVQEGKGSFAVVDDNPTIEKVAAALNAMGVTTRDMMSIFQALKQAGALQAELVME